MESVLFPALVEMQPPPPAVDDSTESSLLLPDDVNWASVERWAMRDQQRAVIEALATVADPDEKYMSTLPYGTDGVDSAWVEAGLAIDLGEPTTIFSMTLPHMAKMRDVLTLATVESRRLAELGDGEGAMGVLVDVLRVQRMLADRAMRFEQEFALVLMRSTMERMLDLLYVYEGVFEWEYLSDLVKDELRQSEMREDKLVMPRGDLIAARQIAARTIVERGDVDAAAMAETVARMTTTGRPLEYFTEYSWWRQIAGRHADWFDTGDKIEGIFKDWQMRWDLEHFDTIHKFPSDWEQMDRERFAMVEAVLRGYEDSLADRNRFLVDLQGTRTAIGMVAFRIEKNGQLPRSTRALHPKYVRKEHVLDWYSYDFRGQRFRELQFFVPMRDKKPEDPRRVPEPHPVTVYLSEGASGGGGGAGAGGLPPEMARQMFTQGYRDALAGSVGGDRADQMMIELEGAAEFFDADAWTVDAEGLREYLLGVSERNPATADDAQRATEQIQSLIDEGITIENAVSELEKRFDELTGEADAQQMAVLQMFGIDMDVIRDVAVGVVQRLVEEDTVRRAFDTVKRGGVLTNRQADDVSEAMVEAAVRQDVLDPLMEMFKPFQSVMNSASGGGLGASFTVEVDDTQFILYFGW